MSEQVGEAVEGLTHDSLVLGDLSPEVLHLLICTLCLVVVAVKVVFFTPVSGVAVSAWVDTVVHVHLVIVDVDGVVRSSDLASV